MSHQPAPPVAAAGKRPDMFAVNVWPASDADFVAICRQRNEIAAVVLAGQVGQSALVFEVADKLADPVLLRAVHRMDSRASVAL